MMYGYYNGFVGHSFFGGFLMILFWITVVFFIVWLVRNNMSHSRHEHKEKTALDILKERYAKGEIEKEEFEIKKKDLS